MSSPIARATLKQVQSEAGDGDIDGTSLNMSGRNIETMASLGSFILPQIKKLNVSNNKLSSLNDLLPMFQLLEFDASHNVLADVDTVLPFPKLQVLNLSHNRIVHLACTMPTSLRIIDLSYNNVYSMDSIAPILSLKGLESLDIRGNPLEKQSIQFDIISNFPQLKVFNGRAIQDLGSSINNPNDLTLSELADKNDNSTKSTFHNKGINSATHTHNTNSTTAAQKVRSKFIIDEQVILFSRSGASSSKTSRPQTATTRNTLSSILANEATVKSAQLPPTGAPHSRPLPQSTPDYDNSNIGIEELQLEPKQMNDQATMPDHYPTYVASESQTDMCYKDVRPRTLYDFSDEEAEAAASSYNVLDGNEAKRTRRIKALLKNSEQVVDSTYIHTLQGQIQSYKQNEEQLRNEIETLEQQLEKLKASNALLQLAVQPVETSLPSERHDFMLSNQIDEVVFLREQVKILDEMLNRQESASAVQFPVPEAIPEYLNILNMYRRKLFHVLFDLRQLQRAKEHMDASCLITPVVDYNCTSMLKMETDIAQLTEEKKQLSEEHVEALRKLTMTEHTARAFHEEVTKYSSILSRLYADLKADAKSEKLEGLDEVVAKHICAYMNTNKAPSLDDAQKYILAASELASNRLAAQCSAIEAVMDRVNDIVSENQVIKEEKERLYRELTLLTRECNELKDNNLLLKNAFKQQREEKARLDELKASGYLDKAVSCTEVDLGEIVHGSTQTYLDEFLTHVETQASPQEFLLSKAIQIVREIFNVDDETQTGNLRELTDYKNSQFDVLSNSTTKISVEHMDDITKEDDEYYQRLMQIKDIYNRSKGTDCNIIPSSVLLKLHINSHNDDMSDSTLDAAIRSLFSTQSNGVGSENSLKGEEIKMDKLERVHAGVQIEISPPIFKAIQCELLQSTDGIDRDNIFGPVGCDMGLHPFGSMNGIAENSHIPRYRSNGKGHCSDLVSTENAISIAFASTQVDAPDMKYFGVQTDAVDIVPYGTLAALQVQIMESNGESSMPVDTKIASTQCEQIAIVFKSIQCPDNELYIDPRTCSVASDTIDNNNTTPSATSKDVNTYSDIHTHTSGDKDYEDDGSTKIKERLEKFKDSPYISRMHSPPQTPYLYALECENFCDTLVEHLYQQTQILSSRELELKDMNEAISDVMKTISSAENKVSDYKRRLRESQDTIVQLQESLTVATAKEAEHTARIKLLEELLDTQDRGKCVDSEIQTRINLADMKLLFAQMRVATSSTSTQYEAPMNIPNDHREVLDTSVIVQNLSGESIRRSVVSRSNIVADKVCKSDTLHMLEFEPTVIPLTPPLSSSPSSDKEEPLETSFRNSPFVTLKISSAEGNHGKANTFVSVFHPSTNVLQKSTKLLEKSSVTAPVPRSPHDELETKVRFFCRADNR